MDFLKRQSQQKDEILYGLLKEDGWQDEKYEEPRSIRYKTSAEIIAEGGKTCQNCKRNKNKGGLSVKCDKKLDDCLIENHKYWEKEDE